MPCPVPDKTKKGKARQYVPGWRKWHMIDLNTLDTKERWLKKLDKLTPDAITAMRAALEELKLSR